MSLENRYPSILGLNETSTVSADDFCASLTSRVGRGSSVPLEVAQHLQSFGREYSLSDLRLIAITAFDNMTAIGLRLSKTEKLNKGERLDAILDGLDDLTSLAGIVDSVHTLQLRQLEDK